MLEKEEAISIYRYFKGSIVLHIPVALHCSTVEELPKINLSRGLFQQSGKFREVGLVGWELQILNLSRMA